MTILGYAIVICHMLSQTGIKPMSIQVRVTLEKSAAPNLTSAVKGRVMVKPM